MLFFVLLASLQSDDDLNAEELREQAHVPDDHPAYDRIQTRVEPDSAAKGVNRRVLGGVALFIVALVITYLIVRPSGEISDTPDLLTLAASEAGSVLLDIETEDLDEAEEYILGEFGWPIRVPVLSDSRLVGVGVDEITDGVELPVLQYATKDSEPITVYVYDYAFLDAAAGRLTLSPAVYARLAEDDGVDLRRVGDYYVLLWRRRAVIYTAVTFEDPALIADGLRLGR